MHAPGDYKAQYIAVMDGLKTGLEAAGATFDNVVHRRAFVIDMDKYLAVTRDPELAGRYWNRDEVAGKYPRPSWPVIRSLFSN